MTTAGLLRAAAPQLADPSSAAPLVPLYLRRPDAVPPTAIKAVTQVTAPLRPMRLGDLPAVMELEEELFAPDTWTAAMYREELALTDTRHYLVAEDEGTVVGTPG